MLCHWKVYIIHKNFLIYVGYINQVWHFILLCFLFFSQVTTEQQEKSRWQVQCYTLSFYAFWLVLMYLTGTLVLFVCKRFKTRIYRMCFNHIWMAIQLCTDNASRFHRPHFPLAFIKIWSNFWASLLKLSIGEWKHNLFDIGN